MKITQDTLKQLIREELEAVLSEASAGLDDLKEEIGSKVISTLINYCNQPCCLPLILKQSKAMAIMITKIGINTALAPSSSILFMTTKL